MKTSRYLKYAIGEILLVVIGILIALRISDWNQIRKDREFELFTLKEVENNLKKDQSQIIEILEKRRVAATAIANLSTIPFKDYDPLKLAEDIDMIWGFERFFAIRNGYEALKSRGFLISDGNLRTALGRYYENELTRIGASIYDLESTFLTDFDSVIKQGHFRRGENNEVIIENIEDPAFEYDIKVYVRGLSPNHSGTLRSLEAFKTTNEAILTQVNTAITKLSK